MEYTTSHNIELTDIDDVNDIIFICEKMYDLGYKPTEINLLDVRITLEGDGDGWSDIPVKVEIFTFKGDFKVSINVANGYIDTAIEKSSIIIVDDEIRE